jgi:hypothetical protein
MTNEIIKHLDSIKGKKIEGFIESDCFQEIKILQDNNLSVTKQTVDLSNTYDVLKVFATGITDLNDRVKTIELTIDSLKKAITG